MSTSTVLRKGRLSTTDSNHKSLIAQVILEDKRKEALLLSQKAEIQRLRNQLVSIRCKYRGDLQYSMAKPRTDLQTCSNRNQQELYTQLRPYKHLQFSSRDTSLPSLRFITHCKEEATEYTILRA